MLKRTLKKILKANGYSLAKTTDLDFYKSIDNSLLLFNELTQQQRERVAPYLPYSKSQLGQDLFALAFAKEEEQNFFVEFGATNGLSLSNTWLLEKQLGWTGILAEPANIWHKELKANRNCSIDTNCVSGVSNQIVKFFEVNNTNGGIPELSGISDFANNGDWASEIRSKNSKEYDVETISLNDLLDKHNAPKEIQFLSIDTEGSSTKYLRNLISTNGQLRHYVLNIIM